MKNKTKIIIIIIIMLLLSVTAIILWFMYINTNIIGFAKVGGFTQEEIDKSKAISNIADFSLVRITYNIIDDTKNYTKDNAENPTINREYIIIFNKDGTVIDVRAKETGYSRESLQEEYNKLIGITSFFTNVSIQNNSLYYNTSYLNGNTLEEIKKVLSSQPNYKYENL